MKVETIGNAILYLGDCRTILPTIEKVDGVITDPPYAIEAHGAGQRLLSRGSRQGIDHKPLPFVALTADLQDAISKFAAEQSSGWALTFCQVEQVLSWRASMEKMGAKYRRAMVWIKPDGPPQLSGDRPAQGYESIVAAWCGKGRSKWNGGGKRGVFVHACRDDNGPSIYPTKKPIALMCDLVTLFSQYGDLICDPCAGSGTTGVAAVLTGRRFIGIEINQRAFDIACERIENAQRQGMLAL